MSKTNSLDEVKNTSNDSTPIKADAIPNEYLILFQKFNDFNNNFKVSKLIRDDLSVGKVFEVIDKNNSNLKYFSEIIESSILEYGPFLFRKQKSELEKSIYHGAVSNYTGISIDTSNDSENLVLLSNFYPNGSLKDFFELPNKESILPFSENTHMQIILYGIASGLEILCENNFPRAVLFKSNVRLDEYLFPKISFYGMEKIFGVKKGDYAINGRILSELPLDFADGEDLEVFCFSLILYEIIMKKNPVPKLNLSVANNFVNGYRPPLDDDIPSCYKDLIEKCWKYIPNVKIDKKRKNKRPKFKEIVKKLKKPEFILDGVDKDAYFQYIKLLDEYKKEVEKSEVKYKFEYFVSIKTDKFKKVCLYSNKEEEDNDTKERNTLNVDYLDLSKFAIKSKIGEGLYGQVFVVEDKETGELYAAKISKKKIFKQEEKNTNIYREAQLISQFNHPCILKFIGYSPLDFDNNKKPVILTEYNSNGSLRNLLDLDHQEVEIDEFDNTKKLMIIYGIASCMSYLHSKGLIHRDLKPENFLLDKFLLPKLANFCYTKNININMSKSGNEMIGLPKYFSPEIFEHEEYSKSSDVYAFSLILYEIVTGIKPFSGKTIYQIMTEVMKGNRPSFDESIPNCYRYLIESCWSQDPLKRPSFDQIIKELITNEEFVNDNVEKEIFQQYIKYINEYVAKYEESHEIIQFEDYFSIKKVDLVSIRKEHFKYRRINSAFQIPNLSFYSKNMKIGEGSFGVIYEVSENSKDEILAAKISKKQLYEMDDDEFLNLQREVEIISQLNNLCILKFHAFSPINFNDEKYPVVITEFVPKGSLQDALNKEKHGLSDPDWDSTTKMINIYGIAFGMSYLHHQNIIHRDLKPDNVLLDELLYPKIADFGLSKKLSNDDKKEEESFEYKLKGTPLYCSPEILMNLNYTKAGDVYAYSFIVYEIVTTETPFKNVNLFTLIKNIINKERPSFDFPIPACYRVLIEKCWSQNPDDRPSFDEILDDLEKNPDFLLEDVDEDRYFNYIEDLNENAEFRKDKINQTTQIKEAEKLSENSENININNNSKRCNGQDALMARSELKNDPELLTDDKEMIKRNINAQTDVKIDEVNNNAFDKEKIIKRSTNAQTDVKIDEVNYDTFDKEKIIKRSTNAQTDVKIDEVNNNAFDNEKMNKSINAKIFEEIENDNSEDTTESDKETSNVTKIIRSNLDSVESQVKVFEKADELEHANCIEPRDESFVNQQNDGDRNNSKSVSIGEDQYDEGAAVHDSELVQQQNEYEIKSGQAKSFSANEDKCLPISSYDKDFVQCCLAEKKPKELIQYLNDKGNYETTLAVFDECQNESPEIYIELCKEGVALDNAVGHHKYALLLVFGNNKDEQTFEVARCHLEAAARRGFGLSCFLLARLLHEHFKEDELAFNVAIEGAKRGDKFSQCITGHFISKGIGTTKNRKEGVRMMLESGVEDYYKFFATDIGLYFLDLANEKEEEHKDENYARAFEWFEKAYMMCKTSATINNYALCFLKGICVKKDIEKVKDILMEGVEKGDPESMYNMAYILEDTDFMKSLEYYKRASSICRKKSESRCSSSITKMVDGK